MLTESDTFSIADEADGGAFTKAELDVLSKLNPKARRTIELLKKMTLTVDKHFLDIVPLVLRERRRKLDQRNIAVLLAGASNHDSNPSIQYSMAWFLGLIRQVVNAIVDHLPSHRWKRQRLELTRRFEQRETWLRMLITPALLRHWAKSGPVPVCPKQAQEVLDHWKHDQYPDCEEWLREHFGNSGPWAIGNEQEARDFFSGVRS